MATGILMPKAGISVESCIITEWLKKPGDQIAVGDILFTYETDKASFECESTESGELLEIFYQDGDEVPVLVNVCAIGEHGEKAEMESPNASAGTPAAEETAKTAEAEKSDVPENAASLPREVGHEKDSQLKISPRARNLASDKNVDVRLASPSGPYGRIIERDIRDMLNKGVGIQTSAAHSQVTGKELQAGSHIGGRIGVSDLTASTVVSGSESNLKAADVSESKVAPEFEDVAFTGIRRAISKRMTESLATIPQLTHNLSFDATEIIAYRAKVKEKSELIGLPNITLNDFILYAVSRLLPEYPALNAHMLNGTNIRYFKNVHLGMAVDTPVGLLVPVIRNANEKSLSQIAVEAKALAKQAQAGTLSVDDMSGGTFTISNLGTFGVESFTPVINPPQTGLLGVNNMIQRVRETAGRIETYPAMGISLTYDHRAIDGAPASRFASQLCRMLENFTLLLAR